MSKIYINIIFTFPRLHFPASISPHNTYSYYLLSHSYVLFCDKKQINKQKTHNIHIIDIFALCTKSGRLSAAWGLSFTVRQSIAHNVNTKYRSIVVFSEKLQKLIKDHRMNTWWHVMQDIML